MSSHPLLMFDDSDATAEESFLPAEKLLAGNPRQTLWQHYSDASGKFFAGIWQSEPGKWAISYTEEEYCQLLQGVSVVTEAGGEVVTLRPGDSFVIPRGFTGTWEVLETTRKIYVIYEGGA